MVRDGKTLFVWGTNPMPLVTRTSARWLVMSSPLSVTVPVLILTRPKSAFSRVDLPAPFGPMMPTSSCSLAVQVGSVEDVDARHVAGDQVVRTEYGALRGLQVRAAVDLLVLAQLGHDPSSSCSRSSSASASARISSSISLRSWSWWEPR